ncbi:MAG: threonylcarbamoyl-AMP synthase [Saprospiraceae bacterium]|nr:threonylcarbamoyl-AMP synthase [Saprospiraceae bacterium]
MTGKDIKRAKELLESGQLVAIPTETVYGLAGNALNEVAVAQIFKVKNRPSFDPLIIHTSSFERIHDYAVSNAVAEKLAEECMPGPLTLLLPKKPIISDLVTAGSNRVAIRIPRHPLCNELLHSLAFPVAAPSANPFGYISPTRAQHVEDQLGDKIPYILDGGPCEVGLESTIVGFENGLTTVYRKGGVPVETIREIVGDVQVKSHSTSNPSAPGMLKSHYAPRVPVKLGMDIKLLDKYPAEKIGTIRFTTPLDGIPEKNQLILSKSGDYAEAARNLFAGMRALDKLDLEIILAELLPDQDLGLAINDRLRRAAAE